MRIAHFTHPRQAQAFIDYMSSKGIHLRGEPGDGVTLWLDDEANRETVENELHAFVREPHHPRYQAASWHSGTTSSGLHYRSFSMLSALKERAGPLTLGVIIASVLVFILMQLLGQTRVMSQLSWPNQDQYFQLWRWFSHIFLHFSLLHIVFNLMWWWYIGGVVEKRLGSGKLFVITLIAALLSGWMQAHFSGILFGGLSGVVYALMGYAWLRGERDAESGVHLERGLIGFAVLWLLIGYLGWFGIAIANAAHLTGLLLGLAMAWVDTRHNAR
ncbi:rhomboid family intramembrane serine protease GlpG [Erwinia sp. OLTSP20]|uniref:rhomboid family intramembrane serine protease GlpG n=1 Tax=unclassified Erwinia TaxID=2622719 RepID=UPI000C18D8BF|nr:MULTISPECIES: rhomboid family intramembrane serine protease GlpG [unclassified Erwinia]PIJ51242.1 rhomboid family intramembrane serine protease GlpG [Erwinia sp. OAMSP11]PIJ73993.1 rhomboid family intramembrane serine protease GlpG [Erwinia sp. OLSSP12]PIJ84000.1 rhomboid family intramembrane serine protease GlpG [Erwinia sp. OLCASP19]PIJ86531.1 rhomboid family intramembrane serine protease GlpG [Erwinia sp. OLMTSP26]PIJ88010.1 rhomboid family intramembrane serine protease GlpG [Erwinia sp.